jgi:uncharacterized protein
LKGSERMDRIPASRTRIRRLPERANYDRDVIHSILDEGFICHVAVSDRGQVLALPTAYARVGEAVYLHGAPANYTLASLASGAPLCITVTLVDGLVLARSTFHHSINYRSVVIFGPASEVSDPDEKTAALEAVVEHIVAGRGAEARGPSASELRATKVIRVDIAEASAKIRSGPPIDDPEDMAIPIWAGVLPLSLTPGTLVRDPADEIGAPAPSYLETYRRGSL